MVNNPPSVNLEQWLQQAAEALQQAAVFLGHGTDNYWDEAVHLTLPSLGLSLESGREVLSRELSGNELQQLQALLDERIQQRIPVPYLSGQAWFAHLPFYVNTSVLIPRSPMAELIECHFQPWLTVEPKHILDLCCGGGCIGIACAEYIPDTKVDLADISEQALQVAQKNIIDYQCEDRVVCYQGDLFSAIQEANSYDVIISNPPYVDAEDMNNLPPEYLHEPRAALAAGEDGLGLVKTILQQAASYLSDEGLLFVEVGNSQYALQQQFPQVPFMWLEFERGGDGVFMLNKQQLEQYFPV